MSRTNHHLLVAIAVTSALWLPSVQANAQGVLSQIFEAAGRASGIKPLEDLARNADAEHKRFKDNNPVYKSVEEQASATVQLPFSLACTSTFETIVGSVRALCSGFNAQSSSSQDQAIIRMAKQRLIDTGVISAAIFNGTTIRWCAGSFTGRGIAPGGDEIILSSDIKSEPIDDIASTLAHEMRHLQQYRSMGSANFKCKYAQEYIKCAGCQDERHPLEREAFQFEAYAANRLSNSPAQTGGSLPMPPRQAILKSAIASNAFLAELPRQIEPKPTPPPDYPDPEQRAIDACTLNGKFTAVEVERCSDDLGIVYQDLLDTIDDDYDSGDRKSSDYYLRVFRDDRNAACTILKAIHRDREIGKIRQETCEIRSRSTIYRMLSFARQKYPR